MPMPNGWLKCQAYGSGCDKLIIMRIVITGAPSSGKSSVIAELQKQRRPGWVMVPESAVVLLSGGYPAPAHDDLNQILSFQQIILHTQSSLEKIIAQKNLQAQHFIFDRAKLDGASFWPRGPEDYFKTLQVDLAQELRNYDAVVFLEIPAEKDFGGVHQARFHDYAQSAASGKVLEQLWSRHAKFLKIAAQATLDQKIHLTIAAIDKLVGI